jgi:hypothetical protein
MFLQLEDLGAAKSLLTLKTEILMKYDVSMFQVTYKNVYSGYR